MNLFGRIKKFLLSESELFIEGQEARQAHQDLLGCPYAFDDVRWSEWARGWLTEDKKDSSIFKHRGINRG